MTKNNCSRCGRTLQEPITANANYVVHDDFKEEEEVEAHYGLKHTRDTIQHVAKVQRDTGRDFDAIAAEMAHPNADEVRDVTVGKEKQEFDDGTFVETAKKKSVEFSIPEIEFDEEKVDTPERIKDDDVALVKTVREEQPVQKTGLSCRTCVKDDDEIIWGPDK